jgi:hypothetical protein
LESTTTRGVLEDQTPRFALQCADSQLESTMIAERTRPHQQSQSFPIREFPIRISSSLDCPQNNISMLDFFQEFIPRASQPNDSPTLSLPEINFITFATAIQLFLQLPHLHATIRNLGINLCDLTQHGIHLDLQSGLQKTYSPKQERLDLRTRTFL